MFFLLKCAFWLALVYAAMIYGLGPIKAVPVDDTPSKQASRSGAEEAAHVGKAVVHAAVDGVATQVTALCAHRAAECIAEAARLTALFDASGAVDPVPVEHVRRTRQPSGQPAVDGSERLRSASVPMPVPDPRRQGNVSRLTRGL